MSNRFRTTTLVLSGVNISIDNNDSSSFLSHDGTFKNVTTNLATSGNLQSTGIALTSSLGLLSGNLIQTGINLRTYIDSIPKITGISITGDNSFTGILNINAGTNITLTKQGNNTLSIASSAVGGGGGAAVTGLSITGGIYTSGINGQFTLTGGGNTSIFLNGQNNIVISGIQSASSNNSFNPSGSGAYIFRTAITNGVSSQFISFPSNLSNNPRIIATLNNNYDNTIIPLQISGSVSSGFWAIFGNNIPNTGFFLDTYAITSDTGLSSTIFITNNISQSVTGVSSYIPKFNYDNNGLINSVIYENNNLVGFNTNNPIFDLDLHGNLGIQEFNNNTLLSGSGNISSYTQLNIQNYSNNSGASSDLVATADIGNENNYYVNLGVNSSTYSGALVGLGADSYLISKANDLFIGNVTANKNVHIFAGSQPTGTNSGNITIYPNRVDVHSCLQLSGNCILTNHSGVSLTGITPVAVAGTYIEIMSGVYDPGGWLFLANICAHAPTQTTRFTLNTRLWDGVSQTYYISQANTCITGLGGIGIINTPIVQFINLTGINNRVNLSCTSDVANVRIRNLPSGNLPVGTTSGTTTYMRGIRLY